MESHSNTPINLNLHLVGVLVEIKRKVTKHFFQSPTGKGESAAVKVFDEICGRTMMLQMIIDDKSGKAAAMSGGGSPVDYGQSVRSKFADLMAVIPPDAMMRGMMSGM